MLTNPPFPYDFYVIIPISCFNQKKTLVIVQLRRLIVCSTSYLWNVASCHAPRPDPELGLGQPFVFVRSDTTNPEQLYRMSVLCPSIRSQGGILRTRETVSSSVKR